jgi:uncharacterized protein YndB with AHSA1/START domain
VKKTKKRRHAFGVLEIRIEARFAAPRRRVYAALTRDIGKWWPKGFVAQKSSTGFFLEPRVGGRAGERGPGGQGLLWWTVTGLEKDRRMLLAGDLTAAFGGPARIFEEFTLEDEGKGTRLVLVETIHGSPGKDLEANLRGGWELILEKGLRPWLERRR